jgi:hypothetical protein
MNITSYDYKIDLLEYKNNYLSTIKFFYVATSDLGSSYSKYFVVNIDEEVPKEPTLTKNEVINLIESSLGLDQIEHMKKTLKDMFKEQFESFKPAYGD